MKYVFLFAFMGVALLLLAGCNPPSTPAQPPRAEDCELERKKVKPYEGRALRTRILTYSSRRRVARSRSLRSHKPSIFIPSAPSQGYRYEWDCD